MSLNTQFYFYPSLFSLDLYFASNMSKSVPLKLNYRQPYYMLKVQYIEFAENLEQC